MAIKRITIRFDNTKLYDEAGTHVSTVNAGEYFDGADTIINVPERGECYKFRVHYVRKSLAALSDVPVTPPQNPIPTAARIVLTEKDGRQRIFDEVL